jgi:hypothetical protein
MAGRGRSRTPTSEVSGRTAIARGRGTTVSKASLPATAALPVAASRRVWGTGALTSALPGSAPSTSVVQSSEEDEALSLELFGDMDDEGDELSNAGASSALPSAMIEEPPPVTPCGVCKNEDY